MDGEGAAQLRQAYYRTILEHEDGRTAPRFDTPSYPVEVMRIINVNRKTIEALCAKWRREQGEE